MLSTFKCSKQHYFMLSRSIALSYKLLLATRSMSAATALNFRLPKTTFDQNSVVGYVTDVEGNLNYWNNYLGISNVLHKVGDKLCLKENCQFVFGGDVCDRGAGDIRILSDLVNLKLNYPDRVHFILGNRDINKLRVPFTLQPTVLEANPRVYWVRKGTKPSGEIQPNSRSEKMKWVSDSICLS